MAIINIGPKHLLNKQVDSVGISIPTVKIIEVTKEVPVEIIREVIKEVKVIEVQIIEKPIEKIVEVIREVPVEVIKEIKVIQEKPIEIIKNIDKEITRLVFKTKVPKLVWLIMGVEALVILFLLYK